MDFADKYEDIPRPEILAALPPQIGRLLDVGCGRGALGRELKLRDPSIFVAGVEPSAEAARVAQSRLDAVVSGTYPCELPNERFDTIVFADVLEHMIDPWEALRHARERDLMPNGYVIASIPNIRNVDILFDLVVRGKFNYVETGILDSTHLRFFTWRSIETMFAAAGFRIERRWAIDCRSPRKLYRALRRVPGRAADDVCALQFVVQARPIS